MFSCSKVYRQQGWKAVCLTLVAVHTHVAVSLVVLNSPSGLVGTVDRDLGVVGAQTMQVGVMVREQTTLRV